MASRSRKAGDREVENMTDEKKRNRWFIATIVFLSVYLIWRIFFTLPWREGILQTAAGIALAAAETVTSLGMMELMVNRMKSSGHEIPLPDVSADRFPDVDVFIATHNESPKLLYKTINACTFLEYPDPDKVHIYVCDDGDREEIRELAEHLGVGYLGLSDNRHAKSGNYNYALSRTSSPLIATFDADMIPRRKFLIKTVRIFSYRISGWGWCRPLRASIIRICSSSTCSRRKISRMSRISFPGRSM